jgi:sugar lactone lactonase YvrE
MKKRHLKKVFWLVVLCVCLIFINPADAFAVSFKTTVPIVTDPAYKIQILVPGSYFHGIHGLTFDSQDNLYAGSVVGAAIYHVDTNTGEVEEFIGPPNGMADDLIFGPDGRIYYTSYLQGKLQSKGADGKITVLADNLMGINSLAFNKEGRLFATQVFLGDALYEIDLTGQQKTRKIAEKLGGLNGFDFGPDNMLYGPLWFKGVIAKVDVATGKVDVVASGFKTPAAVNFDSNGNLFALDTATGEVVQVDVKTGQKKTIAKLDPSLDNLAIDSKDRIFVSNMSKNGIYEIDRKTGKSRTVVEGVLSCATGIAVASGEDGDTLYVADIFSYKKVDGFTGGVTMLMASHAEGSHIAYPSNISVNKDKVLLIGLTGVQVIDRVANQAEKMVDGLRGPAHALMMDDGSILVTEMPTGKLLKVAGDSAKNATVVAEKLVTPGYLAWAGDGAVYVTEVMAGVISRIELATGQKKVIASGLRTPKGVGVLPDGKLAVVEGGTRQVVLIDPASGAIKPLAMGLAVGYPPGGPPPGMLTGLAVSKSGAIYIAGDIENVIYKIMPK